MALKIRMARAGAKKRPFFSIVVADSRSPRDGRFIEKLGTYNPMLAKDHPERVKLKTERVLHWLGVGALPSERVARFLGEAGLRDKPSISRDAETIGAAQEGARARGGRCRGAGSAGGAGRPGGRGSLGLIGAI